MDHYGGGVLVIDALPQVAVFIVLGKKRAGAAPSSFFLSIGRISSPTGNGVFLSSAGDGKTQSEKVETPAPL